MWRLEQSEKDSEIIDLTQQVRDGHSSIDQLQAELRSLRSDLDTATRDAATFKRQAAAEVESLTALFASQREDLERRSAAEQAQSSEEIDRLRAESARLRANLEAGQTRYQHEETQWTQKVNICFVVWTVVLSTFLGH